MVYEEFAVSLCAPIGITPGQLRESERRKSLKSLGASPMPVQCALAAQLRTEIAAATDLRISLEKKLTSLDRLPDSLLRQVFGDVKPA